MIRVSLVQRIFYMSHILDSNIEKIVRFEEGRNLIITVGNTLRSDDGVGPYIASRLKVHERVAVIDAGTRPENVIDEASSLKPDMIIIIDAADFGGVPGEMRLIPEELIPETTVSTHSIPLCVITQLLRNDTHASVFFIGIQAKTMALGESLSPEVKKAADMLIRAVDMPQS